MAYVVMTTRLAGYIVLNTDWDIIIGNFAAGVPDLFTTDGDIAIGTGVNAAERVNAFDSSNLLLHERGGVEADISAITTGDTIVGQSSGVAGLETAMSQAQAEAGTDTQVRGITAARVKEAIDALSGVTQADQTAIEAETNENTYAPPDLLRHQPGIAKVWVVWEQSGAHGITGSYNMTSVTDGGAAGDTDHLFDTDFSGTLYTVTFGGEEGSYIGLRLAGFAATGCTTLTSQHTDDAGADFTRNNMSCFGDQ